MNIPTARIEWDEESCPPICRVIDEDTGECVAVFEDEDDAASWAVRHGYDLI